MARFSVLLLPEFFSCPCSPERDTTTQACRFSCFFCAAYGLLLPQTRTGAQTVRREQSLCSKNLRKFLQMPGQCYPSQVSMGHVENSCVFLYFAIVSCFAINNDLGVKTLITDCFVLRTSTILPRIRNPWGPRPTSCSCGAGQ